MTAFQIGNVVIFPKMSDLDNSVVMLKIKKIMTGHDVKLLKVKNNRKYI